MSGVADVATRQAGAFSVEQAVACGLSRGQIAYARRHGLLRRVAPNVLMFAGTPLTDGIRHWAAFLQAGPSSVISHEAALRALGVLKVPPVVTISVPAGTHPSVPGVRVHRVSDLVAEHVTPVDGLPVTTLERAVVDTASVFRRVCLEHLVDDLVIRERATSIARISRTLHRVQRRGRRNIGVLGGILDARSPGEPAPRSLLERRLDDVIARAGLPTPVPEYPLPSVSHQPGFVDRAFPEVRLIVEADGRRWHARELNMAKDRARDRDAARLGWLTVRYLCEELDQELAHLVVGELIDIYARRLNT